MALFVFCTFFFLAVAAATEEANFVSLPRSDEHNIINCENVDQANWINLYKEVVSAKRKFLQIVQKTITIPKAGLGEETITCIRITDLSEDGHGGYPELQDGGLGFRYVTIHLKSQRNYGFKFQVEVWGKK